MPCSRLVFGSSSMKPRPWCVGFSSPPPPWLVLTLACVPCPPSPLSLPTPTNLAGFWAEGRAHSGAPAAVRGRHRRGPSEGEVEQKSRFESGDVGIHFSWVQSSVLSSSEGRAVVFAVPLVFLDSWGFLPFLPGEQVRGGGGAEDEGAVRGAKQRRGGAWSIAAKRCKYPGEE